MQERCQSTTHTSGEECYGALFRCGGCRKYFCQAEAVDDEGPDLCDGCFELEALRVK